MLFLYFILQFYYMYYQSEHMHLLLNMLKIKSTIAFKSSPHTDCLISTPGTKIPFPFKFEVQESSLIHFKPFRTMPTNSSSKSAIPVMSIPCEKKDGKIQYLFITC